MKLGTTGEHGTPTIDIEEGYPSAEQRANPRTNGSADAGVRYSGFFDIEKIRAIKRARWKRRTNAGYHPWGLLTLLLWMDKWRIQIRPLAEQNTEKKVLTST